MYLFDSKTSGKIDIFYISVNNTKLREFKEKEVFKPLNYKKVYKATTNRSDEETLLKGNTEVFYDGYINYGVNLLKVDQITSFYYHNFDEDRTCGDEVFKYIGTILKTPVLKCVKVNKPSAKEDDDVINYYCLTDPVYKDMPYISSQSSQYKNHRQMKGIMPVSEELFKVNKLVEIVYNNDFNALSANAKDFVRYQDLFNIEYVKTIDTPDVSELYILGVLPGKYDEYLNRIENSSQILRRVNK